MPGLNQRGPEGQGPLTGRGMGRCRPENKNNEEDSPVGLEHRGFGRGRGRGRSRGFGFGGGANAGRGRGRGFGFGNRKVQDNE